MALTCSFRDNEPSCGTRVCAVGRLDIGGGVGTFIPVAVGVVFAALPALLWVGRAIQR